MATRPADEAAPHHPFEDALALLIGSLFCAAGIYLLHAVGLATGGIAGLALLVSYVVPVGPGRLFVLINLPFYYFAWRALGPSFAAKTVIATVLVGILAPLLPGWMSFGWLNPVFASLFAGTLIGMGILALARHRAGVGGSGVLALFLQHSRGWRAGYVQMAFDGCILLASLFVFSPSRVFLSVLSAATMNLIFALNHKPGRYLGY